MKFVSSTLFFITFFLIKESLCYDYFEREKIVKILEEIRVPEDDDLCQKHLDLWKDSLIHLTEDMWALRMFDAWSKFPPAGMLQINRGELGNIDECIKINVEVNETRIRGKYCLGTIDGGIPLVQSDKFVLNFKNISGASECVTAKIGNAAKHGSHNLPQCQRMHIIGADLPGDKGVVSTFFRHRAKISPFFPLLTVFPHAICVPNSCSDKSIEERAERFLNVSVSYECQDYNDAHPDLSTGAIITICFFAVITALILTSSFYDYYVQTKKMTPKFQIFVAFSAYTNFPKLMKISSGSSELHCLNGIRVLSMFWVIIGHTAMEAPLEPVTNFLDFSDWMDQWHSMILVSGTLAVDTFFVVGGLLVVYIYMKSVHNKIKFNIFMFYVHRYLRLTPALAASVLLNANLVEYFAYGPIWSQMFDYRLTDCKNNWWGTLLYVQNYIDADKLCLDESWYLDIDMQLYIISPIFLLILTRWKKIGISLLGLGMTLSIVASFVVTWHFNVSSLLTDMFRSSVDFNTKYYLMTHTRAAPWFIGAIAGYFVAEIKFSDKKMKINKFVNVFIWLVVFILMLVVVLVGHDTLRDEEYNRWGCSLYNTFIRPTWGLCVAWIIFACVTGNGGIVNSILSLPIFQVLNRFTYSIYLIHVTIIYGYAFSRKTGVYFSIVSVCLAFWGYTMTSFLFSIYWVLAFESPIIIIEKVMFGKLR